MSLEKVEILREMARLYEAADWSGLGARLADDIRLWPPDGWPEPGPFFGRAAVVREFQRIREPWERASADFQDPLGPGDPLVVRVSWGVEGKRSSAPVETTVFVALRFKDDQISEWRAFWTRAEAVDAAGLRE